MPDDPRCSLNISRRAVIRRTKMIGEMVPCWTPFDTWRGSVVKQLIDRADTPFCCQYFVNVWKHSPHLISFSTSTRKSHCTLS